MTAMIQIRNVPDTLHRRLKSRAALAGTSLSDYLLSELRLVAERPTLDELRARLEHRPVADRWLTTGGNAAKVSSESIAGSRRADFQGLLTVEPP